MEWQKRTIEMARGSLTFNLQCAAFEDAAMVQVPVILAHDRNYRDPTLHCKVKSTLLELFKV